MAEYISREAVEQVLRGIANGISVGENTALESKDVHTLFKIKGAKDILRSVDDCICDIPSADVQPTPQWISVKERLPEIGKSILIHYPKWDGDEIQVAKLEGDGMMFDICGEFNIGIGAVTHWMPLPELPKSGDVE